MELTATVAGAVLPGGHGIGQDRWAATDCAVVVLDGASAVEPGTPPADTYVDELSAALAATLADGADTRQAIRESIGHVAHRLDLTAGEGPSSTVLLVSRPAAASLSSQLWVTARRSSVSATGASSA
jgi:hydroxymethylpyrimidine/phosphomethylpyrimidine kinase